MNLRSSGFALAMAASLAFGAACSPAGDEVTPVQDSPAEPAKARPHVPSRAPKPKVAEAPAPPSSGGQVKYINERGQVQVAASLEDVPESQRSTVTAFESVKVPSRPAPAPSAEDERQVSNADVTIFTTSRCGYCRAAMAYFDQQGISYENRDVESDRAANREYLKITGGRRGVPVIVVGEQWMQGWSQEGFNNLLASAE